VRGAERHSRAKFCRIRITPACAGSRNLSCFKSPISPDHPRVCGEQLCPGHYRSGRIGSPPRVRGAVSISLPAGSSNRITPACAGSRLFVFLGNTTLQDHPRVCGEQMIFFYLFACNIGSPPRVRGAAIKIYKHLRHKRITPACAGSRKC